MAKIITENFKVETTKELFGSFVSNNATVSSNFATSLGVYDTSNSLSLSSSNVSDITGIVNTQLANLNPESDYYIMGSSIDKPNSIANTQFEKREFERRVIFGNKVGVDEIRYMFNINNWAAGTVYDDFDDTQDASLLNMIVTVVNDEGNYYVFKCLDNNNGGPSTSAPSLNEIDTSTYELIISSDGYVWKYMFSVTSAEAQVFATTDSLPLPYPALGDTLVQSGAKEGLSQIVITNTPSGLFSKCVFGPGTTTADASTVACETVTQDSALTTKKSIVVKISPKSGSFLDTSDNSYANLYLWRSDGKVFDVITSAQPSGTGQYINIVISTSETVTSFTQGGKTYKLLPKIRVSRSTSSGTPCVAYGIIDQFGTLTKVAFTTKGSEYKYATAKLILPAGVAASANEQNLTATSLRPIISPTGGHGSNAIAEMSMSRLGVVTNFSGEDVLTPNANFYTKVALVKNPIFNDATKPAQLDNRTVVTLTGDVTSVASVGRYITQTISLGDSLGTEQVVGKIHQSVYDGTTNTKVYLVDYTGDFQNSFQTGKIFIKTDPALANAVTAGIDINNSNVVYGNYKAYSGDILHFVDFDPIQRQADRKEKIKFIFDF
jgi:hypothetical protein|tara:strand:+ start:2057 stop:3877 length:1821 start_codon:yes stop_codon:yes gene_type:complete